ncbi:MAG: A/G-specific adenine glycosylase [Clostridia bacterium]|nr:A/G-specific adenine glycosylase [Clostridia bacterium]
MDEIELLKNAVPPLLKWYRIHKRELPWRGTHDPYRVWISEIMLQQTRVEAVKQYYIRFLEKFPTAEALARAEIEEVLKAWEGLGYYSRARNLHAAAKLIAQSGFPRDWAGVRSLPGIGDYTAGAICSIAYDLPFPAVDGNVLRVLTRLMADARNIDDNRTKAQFAEALKEVYPEEAGDFCQSLMELGAIVCVPNGAPLCGECPWREICRAHLAGEEERYPVRAEKRARKLSEVNVYVLEREGRFALCKRGENGLLAGLWQFPLAEKDSAPDPARFGEVLATKSAKHVFTHVEWRMTGYFVRAKEFFSDYVWVDAKEIAERYALPSALKAFVPWLSRN